MAKEFALRIFQKKIGSLKFNKENQENFDFCVFLVPFLNGCVSNAMIYLYENLPTTQSLPLIEKIVVKEKSPQVFVGVFDVLFCSIHNPTLKRWERSNPILSKNNHEDLWILARKLDPLMASNSLVKNKKKVIIKELSGTPSKISDLKGVRFQ